MSASIPAPSGPVVHTMQRLGAAPVALAWYGAIAPSQTMGGSVTSFQLVAHRLSEDATRLSGAGDVPLNLPVAFLRLFRLGDIWQGGQRRATQPLERVTFKSLVVDDSNCDTVPSGLGDSVAGEKQGFLLPFSAFNAHRDHTKSFVARVEMGDGRRLIVPSMELVRFYFGDSGSLVSAIFSGALANRELYSAARVDRAGVANIALGPKVSGIAAAAVARIALDTSARRAFRWIVNSGVAASLNRQPWYPRMGFPFVGKTDLTVEGRWLDEECQSFLAYRLIRCTFPFPFSTLYYRTPPSSVTAPARQAIDGVGKAANSESGGGSARLTEGETSRSLTPVAVEAVDESVPFPDLLNKRIVRARSTGGGGSRVGSDGVEAAAVGPASDAEVRAADVVFAQDVAQETLKVPLQLLDLERAVGDQPALMSIAHSKGGVYAMEVETDQGPVTAWAAVIDLTIADGSEASMVAISIDDPVASLAGFDCTGRNESQIAGEVVDFVEFVLSNKPRVPLLSAERRVFSTPQVPVGLEPMKTLLFQAWDFLSTRYPR